MKRRGNAQFIFAPEVNSKVRSLEGRNVEMNRWKLLAAIGFLMAILAGCGNQNADQEAENGDTGATEDQAAEEATDAGEDAEGTDTDQDTDTEEGTDQEGQEVTVKLNDVEGAEVGTAVLTANEDGGVHVDMKVTNLPEGPHAFHIHEKGACEAPDFESAGGHYNPEDKDHGKNSENGPHAGDFDNIEVGEDGTAHVEFDTDQVTLDENADNTLFTAEGTSLVIHGGEDDYESQPAGDAGPRIACGVIEK